MVRKEEGLRKKLMADSKKMSLRGAQRRGNLIKKISLRETQERLKI
jgi:hypothetical protein